MAPWNVAHQASLSMGIFQARILEWVAMASSRGIFPIQGSNPGLPHCRQIPYQPSHQGNPRILEWVAYPFSRDLSNPGIRPGSPALQVDSLPSELPGKCICRWSRHCSHLHYWWRSQVSGSLANMTGIVQSGTRGERMCSPAIWAQGPCSEPPRASSFLGVLNVPQTVGQWKELLKHFLCMVLTMYFFILWKKR